MNESPFKVTFKSSLFHELWKFNFFVCVVLYLQNAGIPTECNLYTVHWKFCEALNEMFTLGLS